MLKEFKAFILKGNVVDLSTGVIIGAAFTAIVTAFSKGIVEPILALFGNGPNPKLTIPLMEKMVEVAKVKDGKAVMDAAGKPEMEMVNKLIELDLGGIIGAFISFMITAAVVFFVIIKPTNTLLARMKKEEAVAPPPEPSSTDKLLGEILATLKAKQ